jgi:(1->4)-alpha-D-glucan 1-alpha-D-glucosylmutase
MLSELEGGMDVEEIVRRMDSGLPKLWIVHNALCLRREHPEWFGAEAEYTPLVAEGSKGEHLVGYLRGTRVATLVPRWTLSLSDRWGATTVELPPGQWTNVLTRDAVTGGRLHVQTLLQRFPVALLTREVE